MIAADGDVCHIDLGLAKRLPFASVHEEDDSEELHYRSYTVCGTPEYLAPEFRWARQQRAPAAAPTASRR